MAKILIVDDHPVNRQFIVKLFGYFQHTLYEAADGVEGLRIAQEVKPDLIITDVVMPQMDGMTFIKELRLIPALAKIPVIIYTASYRVPEAREMAHEYGVEEVLHKPARPDEILGMVNRLLGLGTQQISRPSAILDAELMRLAAIVELGLDLTKERNPAGLLQKFCQALRYILRADSGGAIILDPKGKNNYSSIVSKNQGLASPMDPRSASQILGESVNWQVSARLTRPNLDHKALGLLKPIQSLLAVTVPIPGFPSHTAWLFAADKADHTEFTPEDERLIVTLAMQVAITFENARLHSEASLRAVELQEEIVERKRIEAQLRVQTTALTAAANGVVIADLQGNALWINPAFTRITGFSEADAIGKNLRFLKSGHHDRAFYQDLWKTIKSGAVWTREMINRRKDGTLYTEDQTVTPVRDESGEITCFIAVKQDITESKRLADQYRKAQERLQHVVMSSPAVLFTLPANLDSTTPVWVSGNVFDMLGYSVEEILDANWWPTHVHPDEREDLRIQIHQQLSTRGHAISEYRIRHKDGTYRWVRSDKRLLRDAAGQPLEIVGSWSDITEHKKLEEQYRQAQKMEAVGKLAGGVAHDFNNLLTIIMGYSDIFLTKLRSEDPLRHPLMEIHKAGERAAGLTRQLLAFSRKQILAPVVLDPNAIIADMEKMLHRLIGEDVSLTVKVEAGLWKVKADPGQLEQVLMNIIVNARDAMPQGGKILLETKNVELDDSYVQTHSEASPGEKVLLAISDTGCGMEASVKAHIFEPFFTTKGPTKGTGLGLATVFGIVKQSGGHIEVYSEVGQGTTFKIYLPRDTSGEPLAISHRTKEPLLGGKETILLVEDDEGVRVLAQSILQKHGYTVLEAEHGGDALILCETRSQPIDLMITDVVMPYFSGPQLAQKLAMLKTSMKVLFMSGYTDDAIVHHGVLESGMPFLQKPFAPDALVRKVREVLDAPLIRSKE